PKGWRMRVIGPDEGGHTEEIKRAVEQAWLADQWSFEGSLEGAEKLTALGSAELFALPTYSENFGIVVAEALAAGTPVITTTCTPWQGLLEHNCGWWVDPTCEALAGALESALACEDRSQMGQRGAVWVKNEFAWDEIGLRIVAAYRNILHGH
ncbi:glycosyltransferase, partial [Akkermansiaceae bacterium]|nr:glycosyltransferase [Akkermansiaceae bacterium]